MGDFQRIYEEYAGPVYRFLLQLTACEDQAEELLQETFYRALQHIDQFRGQCSLYTWLCQIGKNAWYKECRRRGRFRDMKLCEGGFPDHDPQEILLEKEERHRMRKAILNLPELYRDVFVIHVLGGVKLREVASLYGKSESWARVTFYRAKQQLLKEVQK